MTGRAGYYPDSPTPSPSRTWSYRPSDAIDLNLAGFFFFFFSSFSFLLFLTFLMIKKKKKKKKNMIHIGKGANPQIYRISATKRREVAEEPLHFDMDDKKCGIGPGKILFCFVLFCFVLFCFVLFCFVLFCFILFCFYLVLFLFCFFFCLLLLEDSAFFFFF